MYRHEWESDPEFAGWLSQDPTDFDKAYCNYCETSITCSSKSKLTRHAETQKHAMNSPGWTYPDRDLEAANPCIREEITAMPMQSMPSQSRSEQSLQASPDLHTSLRRMENLLMDVQWKVTVLETEVQSCQRRLKELSERESDMEQKVDELVVPNKKVLGNIINISLFALALICPTILIARRALSRPF